MADARPNRSVALIRQLLLSHLSVALVGFGILIVALLATDDLRGRVIVLAQESGPMTQASYQLLTGVRDSLANLYSWARLGNRQSLSAWRSAWLNEIQPAIEALKNCPPSFQAYCGPIPLAELQTLLADLQESQWWVQDTVQAPGNEPARLLYLREAEPSAEKLQSLGNALFQDEEEREGNSERKRLLASISKFNQQLSIVHLLLRENLAADGASYLPSLQESLKTLQTQGRDFITNPFLVTEQRQIIPLLILELDAFVDIGRQIIALRNQPHWNIALQRMTEETNPLADQLIAKVTAIAQQANQHLDEEILAARTASATVVWELAAMLAMMLVVAFALSKRRAAALAAPITSLAEATRQLIAGDLHRDLPVGANNELDQLTHAFNSLRASIQHTQEKLRESNNLLEQRVKERTADLERLNQILTHEIHSRNQTEIALRESEARLRATTRAIPDLVFVMDEEGRYREILASGRTRIPVGTRFAREGSSNIHSMPATALHQEPLPSSHKRASIGMTPIRDRLLHDVHSPQMADFFLDIIRRSLATRQIQIAEYELQTTSGLRWFESRTAPLDVRFDGKAAAIVIAHDITKRKHAEAQLRQAQKMQAIGHLTGGIAHDFNNLLAVIMGNLELLNEQLLDYPALHDLAQEALKAVDRGTHLTRRLLAFSRRQPLSAQPTDLNKLVRGMLDLMRRTLGANIEINTLLADDLPLTLIDADELENALLNLVINARDAMPDGGKLTLETAKTLLTEEMMLAQPDLEPGPYLSLAVKDTGMGMPRNVLERAFEPFFTTKEAGKGSGFGLSIVYGLVKQSGGHITIHSEPNQGTIVQLYLPPIKTTTTLVAEPPISQPVIQGSGELILVVEDDDAVRLFAVNALRALGYWPIQASNAVSALEILESTPHIALLFTDIVMPGEMDGVKLAAEAQRRYPGLRVLYTSGYTEHTLIGNMDILSKPYRKADLGKKLRLLLDQPNGT